MTKVQLPSGDMVWFDACLSLMDDDICNHLNAEFPDTLSGNEQRILDAYCVEHFAKFGEIFHVN